MSPLERLGLEVAAFNLLGNRGKAALLCELINANGRTVLYDQLQAARAWRWVYYSEKTGNGLKARICWLREALEDVGHPGVILNEPKVGYSLPEPGRTQIIDRLIEEASA